LRDYENASAVEPIHPHACERRKKKCGNLSGEGDDAKKQRRSREFVNQPAGGDARHPCADERNTLSGEKKTVVAVTQRAPDSRAARQFFSWTDWWAGGFAQLLVSVYENEFTTSSDASALRPSSLFLCRRRSGAVHRRRTGEYFLLAFQQRGQAKHPMRPRYAE
jgi:hypothetical protein